MMNRMALKNCNTLNKTPVMVIKSSTLPRRKPLCKRIKLQFENPHCVGVHKITNKELHFCYSVKKL